MDYFVAKNGQKTGPFPVSQLIAEGVTPETLVWCQGMAQWTPAKDVAEIASMFAQVPPQAPIPPYGPQPGYQQPGYGQQGYGPQPAYNAPDSSKEVGFTDALKICFSKFATFSGRARRSEFWYFYLWQSILSTVTCGIAGLVFFIPSLAVTARRLHDTGRSAWWIAGYGVSTIPYLTVYVLYIIDMINSGSPDPSLTLLMLLSGLIVMAMAIVMLCFLVGDSQPGDNQYGPNPKY